MLMSAAADPGGSAIFDGVHRELRQTPGANLPVLLELHRIRAAIRRLFSQSTQNRHPPPLANRSRQPSIDVQKKGRPCRALPFGARLVTTSRSTLPPSTLISPTLQSARWIQRLYVAVGWCAMPAPGGDGGAGLPPHRLSTNTISLPLVSSSRRWCIPRGFHHEFRPFSVHFLQRSLPSPGRFSGFLHESVVDRGGCGGGVDPSRIRERHRLQ